MAEPLERQAHRNVEIGVVEQGAAESQPCSDSFDEQAALLAGRPPAAVMMISIWGSDSMSMVRG